MCGEHTHHVGSLSRATGRLVWVNSSRVDEERGMAAIQHGVRGLGSAGVDVDLGDVLSRIADELGLGWGLLLGLVVPTLIVLGLGAALTVRLWRRSSRAPSSTTGADLFRGRVVTVATAQGSRGQAFVEGSWWSIRSTDATLRAGQDMRVRAVDGLVLLVEHLGTDATSDEEDV